MIHQKISLPAIVSTIVYYLKTHFVTLLVFHSNLIFKHRWRCEFVEIVSDLRNVIYVLNSIMWRICDFNSIMLHFHEMILTDHQDRVI